MKLSDLINALPALREISNQKCKPKLAYKIALNNLKLQPEIETYEKINKDLLTRLAVPTGDSNMYKVTPEYRAARDEVIGVEVDVKIQKLTLSELEDLQITAGEMFSIMWMIEEAPEN